MVQVATQNDLERPAIDRPASQELENFLTHICWKLQQQPDKPETTLQDVVTAFRVRFRLSIPLMPQLPKLLAKLGVGIEYYDKAKGLDASFGYNEQKQRWVIYAPSDLGMRESFVIMHELSEIVFWRCYHRIPWWREWANSQKILSAHKAADSFAFLTVLPDRKFCNKARALGCDIWKLSSVCQVGPKPCFRAVTQYVPFHFPFFHVWITFNAQPDQCFLTFEEGMLPGLVQGKAYKSPKDEALGVNWENLTPEQFQRWAPMSALENFPAKKTGIEVPPDDVAAIARSRAQMVVTTTKQIAGFGLEAPVDVIARPSETNRSQVYLQAVPRGYADLLLSGTTDMLRLDSGKVSSRSPAGITPQHAGKTVA